MEMNNEGAYTCEREQNPANLQIASEIAPDGKKVGGKLAALSGKDGSPYYDVQLPCGAIVSCNDVIDALDLNYNRGEAFKALWRCGRKPGTSEEYDLEKAVRFGERELSRVKGNNNV